MNVVRIVCITDSERAILMDGILLFIKKKNVFQLKGDINAWTRQTSDQFTVCND
jgi:hypothetical protein